MSLDTTPLSPPHARYGLGAAADSYRISELACPAPPRGLPTEGCYSESGVALVLSGAIEYRGEAGASLAGPGAIIFANKGEYFSCRHVDGAESRRLVLFFGDELLDDIAAASGADAAHFDMAALAPSRPAATIAALLRDAARGRPEAAFDAALAALSFARGAEPSRSVSIAARRRVMESVRYIHDHFAEPCTLDTLAAVAGVSRHHFSRMFKLVTQQTPNQYLIHTRLTAAARALDATPTPIARVALDAGFNDLSHFNASFRTAFGRTPSAWRLRRD